MEVSSFAKRKQNNQNKRKQRKQIIVFSIVLSCEEYLITKKGIGRFFSV